MIPCNQPPNPAVILSAIRAIGYSFETAVADIIDNSISAGATEIKIYSEPAGTAYFAILDNGCGMNESELKNAMLIGSDRTNRTDSEGELGRFGLGLKSASFSQCRKFSVLTRKDRETRAMSYSLDDVELSGEWRSMILNEKEYCQIPEADRLLSQENGTLVVWQYFDRITKNTHNFELSFRKHVKQAKSHVEYVFHRFYDTVGIYFNDVRVDKRDPFLLDSYGMQQEGRGLNIDVNGSKIRIAPYSLPYANALTQEEKRLLGNPERLYDEQGLYLYRNKRLIAWGSWFRTEVRSEFSKLARVRVDIPSSLDDIWMLDVKKSSAKIPDSLRNQIRLAIKDSVSRSRGAVSKPTERETLAEHKVWIRETRGVGTVEYAINRDNPTFKELRMNLGARELALFERFVSELQDYLPKHSIHHDQASDIVITNGDGNGDAEESKKNVLVTILRGVEDEADRETILTRYLAFEQYKSLKSLKSEILEEVRNG